MKKVLVTGGAGYIGSHTVIALFENGYFPIIVDNFSNSYLDIVKKLELITKKKITYYKIDLRNKKKLNYVFNYHKFNAVIHCAGSKSVLESIQKPNSYFNNNLISTLSLLETMQNRKVFNLIFSSSATVYDKKQNSPLKETDKVGNTSSPYGASKFIIEKILENLAKVDQKWQIKIARYFNPIGNHPTGLITENPKGTLTNLLPKIVEVAKKKLPYLKIYGKNYKTRDGTCIRDFIHVMDIADAHIALLKKFNFNKNLKIYNFGTGKGHSVLEVIKEFEKQKKVSIPFKFVMRRNNDVKSSFCSASKAYRDLSWKAKRNLEVAIKSIQL
jgi:UDP-glucose 4-epimerase